MKKCKILLTDKCASNIEGDFFDILAHLTLEASEEYEYDIELSLLLTTDEEMCGLNKEFRDKDSATDVLSFPQLEDEDLKGLIGDIVISLDTAAKQAREAGIPFEREVGTLFVHGLLHLLGLDHEDGELEERLMFDIQKAVIDVLVDEGYIP